MNKRALYLVGLFLVCLVAAMAIPGRRAFACSCALPGTPVEELSQSAVVFAGRVVEIMEPPAVNGVISSADPLRVTFQVVEVWKGPADRTLVVTTARDSASCGFEFQRGQAYLVYARGLLSQLTTSMCSRTALLSGAGEDLAALGEGVTFPGPDRITEVIWLVWAVLVTLGAVLVFLAIFAVRRLRKKGFSDRQ